jgi:hypothetical protein
VRFLCWLRPHQRVAMARLELYTYRYQGIGVPLSPYRWEWRNVEVWRCGRCGSAFPKLFVVVWRRIA